MTEETKSRMLEAEMRDALGADEVRFVLTWALPISAGATTMDGLRIEYKHYGQKRWTVVKTAIFPGEDQTLIDVFAMLYAVREEERPKRLARG